nr:phosphate/phosphite/phosphonate ABC transporter substrate-binding protein [Candidatus Desulfobia pelagia]
MKNKVLRKVLLCILAAVLCLPLLERVTRVSAADPAAQIKIGVLAKRGDRICLEKWSPMARYLSAVLPEYSFSIVPLDFKEIVPAVEQQEIDFVLANSAIYTGLEILYGVSRIATMKNLLHGQGVTEFGGTVFYKAGRNDINTLKDLSGKSFMGVDRTSFGGWLMALREFKLQNINPDKDFSELLFGDTHDNVVYAVLSGKVDAGTVRTDTLERMAAENKISLNDFKVIPFTRHVDPELTEAIIHESQYRKFPYLLSTHLYPEWPLAKLRGTADEVSRQIAIALYTLPADSEAAQAAQISGWTIPL